MFRRCFRRQCMQTYRSVEEITDKEAIHLYKTVDNVILLDVRSKQEYNEGHLNR